MKIGPETDPITEISGSNPETIIIRGKDLTQELIGRISFTDHIWLLVAGQMPDASQRRVLDSVLVAIAEHGLVPSVQAARLTLAAAPEALQGAVAAGLLGCGSVILGAAQEAGLLLHQVLEAAERSASLSTGAETVLRQYRAERRPVPGYGHPLHKTADPRVAALFSVRGETGLAGAHVEAARVLESLMDKVIGKPLRMNVSVAIPAVLLDAGYPLEALRGIPLIARTASLVGHLLEELSHPIGFRMSHDASAAIRYAGPAPEGFVASD